MYGVKAHTEPLYHSPHDTAQLELLLVKVTKHEWNWWGSRGKPKLLPREELRASVQNNRQKISFAPEHNLPTKGKYIYIYIYIYILEQAASSGKSRVVYLPLSTLLIQLLKKFKMQTLLQ